MSHCNITERDTSIDIARGLAIILVVVGHAGLKDYYWNIIYFFHMPLFFFVSGCFLRPLESFNFYQYVQKLRWNSLYKKFVIYATAFLILSPIFFKLGICNTPVESIRDFFQRFVVILRFRASTIDLLNTFWFMPVLFFTHAISLLIATICKGKNICILYMSILLYFIGRICFINGYKEPYDFSKILYFTGFYLLGYFIYPYLKMIKEKKFIPIISFCVIVYFSLIPHLVFELSYLYYLAAVCGICLVLYVSNQFKGKMALYFSYVGKQTLIIFIFHTNIMKVTEVALSGLNILPYESGWSGANQISIYWPIFSIVGVIGPLLLIRANKYIKGIFINERFIKHN